MVEIYKKSFKFRSKSFEEYCDGVCIKRGNTECSIIADVTSDSEINFQINGDIGTSINVQFELPILDGTDVLPDRVQYGRLPKSLYWDDSNEPIVCNIFKNMTCIRFAMLMPLRIVEFTGEFEKIN